MTAAFLRRHPFAAIWSSLVIRGQRPVIAPMTTTLQWPRKLGHSERWPVASRALASPQADILLMSAGVTALSYGRCYLATMKEQHANVLD